MNIWKKEDGAYVALAPSHTFSIVLYEVSKRYFIASYRDVEEISTRKTISLHPNFHKSWHSLAAAKRDLEDLIMDVMRDESFRKETLRKYGPKGLKPAFEMRKLFANH